MNVSSLPAGNLEQWKYTTNMAHAYGRLQPSSTGASLNKKKKKYPKNQKDLGMACPLLKKARKQGEMLLPSLGPIHLII